jgi:alcohol dehydrogenase class IV
MKQLAIPSEVFLASPQEFCGDVVTRATGKSVALFCTETALARHNLGEWFTRLAACCSLVHISDIPSNPDYKSVQAALGRLSGLPISLAIAVGGGSAIDMAKACSALHGLFEGAPPTPQQVLRAIQSGSYREKPSGVAILAAPTTAGTGSEVTRWATVWDMQGLQKYSVEAPWLNPQAAYIVPQFTHGLPRRLTLATGLDALCQACEAYWAKSTNPMVGQLSLAAIKLLAENLPHVIKNGQDAAARQKVALGSLFSGLAFSNTKTTACHSISYPLTMLFGIEHGLACVITLPGVMQLNLPAISEPAALFAALGVAGTAELKVWLDELCSGILTLSLSAFGVKEADIERIAELSFTLGRMDNNPVPIDRAMVAKILKAVL